MKSKNREEKIKKKIERGYNEKLIERERIK